MKIFVKDDKGYLAWVKENPNGYVLNTDGQPGTGYVILHKASCGMISSDKYGNYTTGQYIKICSNDASELFFWTESEGSTEPSPCGICRPITQIEADSEKKDITEDIHGFEYWIRGYQNFYEPIILAYFRDKGCEATKTGSSIEKNDLQKVADKIETGEIVCFEDDEDRETTKRECLKCFRSRTRIQTDGLVKKPGEDSWYSMEFKSWGGFCSSKDTICCFLGPAGWFMLVDEIKGKPIKGSILVIGGKKPENHENLVHQLKNKYNTDVEIYYLDEMLISPGPKMRHEIGNQIKKLKKCVENIEKSLVTWKQ